MNVGMFVVRVGGHFLFFGQNSVNFVSVWSPVVSKCMKGLDIF